MPMCNICNLGSNKSSSIPCFKCKSLIHRKCLSMSNDTWNWFKSSECNFVCKVCSLPPKPSTQNRASCNSDGESLSRPEPSTPVLITNHDQEESDSGVNTSAWTQIVRQEFAREQRRKQIVITGLKLNPNISHSDNHEEIDRVFEEIYRKFDHREDDKVVYTDDFDFKFLGKIRDDDKPRPILVEFGSAFVRDRYLKMASVLKVSDTYSQVYLQKCLSKEEQKEQYLMREKRRQSRK